MSMKTELTDDQKRVVEFISKKKRALVCEKAGKGKSYAVLAAFIYLKQKGVVDRLLVMAPRNAHEKRVWESECKKHTHLKSISLEKIKEVVGSRSEESVQKYVSNFDVVYCKHSHLKNSLDMLLMLRKEKTLVCMDEVHAFKNPQTKLTLLARAFLKGVYALWALTATPLSKSLEDTYNIINFIKPGALGTFDWFRDCICSTETVRIKTPTGTRKIFKITGLQNEALFKQLTKSLVIEGIATVEPHFFKIPYELSQRESIVYRRIARGIEMKPDKGEEDWIKLVMQSEESEEPKTIKNFDVHSSRFIYLQYAADGIVARDGTIQGHGEKFDKILQVVKDLTGRGESAIVYFDYYHSLNAFRDLLKQIPRIRILESTGEKPLKAEEINEGMCKQVPHIILMTRAGAPSVSFYYINNVIMAHVPTVPEVFIQTVGRITRIDSIYPDNLNVYVPQSTNIDEYKMRLVTSKTEQMESVAGKEKNIPDWYRGQIWSERSVKSYKKYFLWK